MLLLGGTTGLVVHFILQIPLTFLLCLFAAQRIRDFGLTGWLVLLFIPVMILDQYIYVGTLIAMIIILVIPGTQGDNRYGPDPLSLRFPLNGPVSHEGFQAYAPTARTEPHGTGPSHAFTAANAADRRQPSGSVAAELERLDGLRKSGAITGPEFERLKKKILDTGV